MSTPRKPVRPEFDAFIDFATFREVGDFPCAYAVVKFTIAMGANGKTAPAPAEPLYWDIRDEKLKPRVKAGSDYWARKELTDFVVKGSAFAPDGKPTKSMQVSAQIGAATKKIQVFGKRMVEWAGGEVAWVPPPEPFSEMPLVYENAYGGIDFRVRPWKPAETPGYPWGREVDSPGCYPRNPVGKGYLVEPGEVPDFELPNLEDPDDLLTTERIVTRDPKMWYRQPMPWCFDWTMMLTFPRYLWVHSGVDAWFPGPQDAAMPEVRRGYCLENYRDLMNKRTDSHPLNRFYQEGSLGFILKDVKAGEPVVLKGMNPAEPTIRFDLPQPLKSLEFEIEGKRDAVKPRLHHIVCRPAEKLMTMTYAGEVRLPRIFVPGIHKHIPVAIRVNGGAPVPYQTPLTVRDLVEASKMAPPEQPPPPRVEPIHES
jgi:hypothetical protein